MAMFQHLPNLTKRIQIMQKNFKKQLLLQDVKMDGSVNFHANGNINFYPCPWENNKQATSGGLVEAKGRMAINQDGTSIFKAYRKNTGPRRELLYSTRHAVVETTRPIYRNDRKMPTRRLDMEHIYVTFKFPKNLGLSLTKVLFQEEADEVLAFFKTRKEETVWE